MEEENDVGGEYVNVGGENVGSGQVPRVTSLESALVESLRPLRIADDECQTDSSAGQSTPDSSNFTNGGCSCASIQSTKA